MDPPCLTVRGERVGMGGPVFGTPEIESYDYDSI